MNKPVITKEQAEAVEYFRKTFIENPKTSMSNSTLSAALHRGYEIEPEFKEKDFVIYDGEIIQIDKILKGGTAHTPYLINFSIESLNKWFDYEKIERHATPSEIAEEKERRFFKRNGRKPWELRKTDILRRKDIVGTVVVGDVDIDDNAIGLTGKSYSLTIEEIKENYVVACFSHDRLDVKTNGTTV